jgi:anti-sigma factor RsiW
VSALNELTCLELVDLVTEYFEGTLSEPDRMRFDAHLAACRHCQLYLRQIRQTMNALGELPAAAIPLDARETLLRAFRDWKRRGAMEG